MSMCQSPQILRKNALFQKFALSWVLFKQGLTGELFIPLPIGSVEMFIASVHIYFTPSIFSGMQKQKFHSFKWS